MNVEARLIGDAARGILSRVPTRCEPWQPILDGGWIGIGVPEDSGGLGGGLTEVAALAGAVGSTAAPAPVLETVMAAMVLGSCQPTRHLLGALMSGEERAAVVPEVVRSDRAGYVADLEFAVPWGRDATLVVLVAVLAEGGLGVAAVPTDSLTLTRGETLSGEPLDRLRLPSAQLPGQMSPFEATLDHLIDAAAVMTAARMCGAMRTVAQMTVEYAKQRTQFGRTVGGFQAVAHALVRQEGWIALAEAALDSALCGADDELTGRGEPGRGEAARVAAALAVPHVVRVAHQVHGAIGVTREHDLHRYTLRLTSWASSWGSASWWSQRLGRRTVGSDHWRDLVAPIPSA
ncbi:MAG: acyl-CoA dehydrogenase family protein [Solirubrobacteraceae bacterium]